MPRDSLGDAFAAWLEGARRHLPTPLVSGRKLADGTREYRFPSSPALRVVVHEGSLRVDVLHERRLFDTLVDFDIAVERDADGRYYCQWCADNGHAERYGSRTALFEAHTFEPFLEWCRDVLREETVLVMERVPGRWTSARICGAGAVHRLQSRDMVCVVEKVLQGTAQ
jgi:hypothetical protein